MKTIFWLALAKLKKDKVKNIDKKNNLDIKKLFQY